MPRSDPQQQRAYDWEGDFTDWVKGRISRTEMRETIAKCCGIYRVPVPYILFVTKNRRRGRKLTSFYEPDRHRIIIRPRHLQKNTAVHEAAHAVVDWLLGPHLPAHGREWVGVFMVLLERMKIAPRCALVAHAHTKRLQFCPPALVGPAHIRRRYAARVRAARAERRWTD